MMKAGILTISDKGSRGERQDTSGPALTQWLKGRGVETAASAIVEDDELIISSKLAEWADSGTLDIILTTGGTGVSPRDVTPEATTKILDRIIPGFGELMRFKSLSKTSSAILSRSVSGIRGKTLIVNLPGSPRGAVENIEAVWDAIPHAVSKIQGSMEDCAV